MPFSVKRWYCGNPGRFAEELIYCSYINPFADVRFFSSEAPVHQQISVFPRLKVLKNPLTKAGLFPEVPPQE